MYGKDIDADSIFDNAMALGMGFNFKSSKDKRVDDLQGIGCKIVFVSLSGE
jgi:hypothetical protein